MNNLTYSIIPSFAESTSLHIQIGSTSHPGKVWLQFGGLGNDCTVTPPWWVDFNSDPSEAEILEPAIVERILDSLKGVSIPPLISGELGLDGTMYELEFSAGMNQVQYKWWCELPDPWSNLAPLITILNDYIDSQTLPR